MKKLIILFFSIFSLFSYSQEDFKTIIAQNTCKCVKDVKKENLTKKQIEFQFGICMFKVANPYKAEIKKEFGIDISDFSKKENMYKLGTEIGILMAQECPDVFEQFIPEDKNDTQTEEVVSSEELMNGEITKIEKDAFVIFYLKGDNGILTRFYWISNVDSNIELEKKYQDLVGKKVNITYYSADIFDHKINDYRKVNILSMLKTE